MASKWKGTYDSGRKYNKAWEGKFIWLTKASDGSDAFCKLCNATIRPKQANLTKHEETEKHMRRGQAQSRSPSLCSLCPVVGTICHHMPKGTQAQGTSCFWLFSASFEKIAFWPLLVDFGYFSNYIWLQAAQESTNPDTS